MKFRDGFLELGKWQKVPIRVHFATPIGLFILSGMRFAPWYWLAASMLILIHEIGHAVIVKLNRAEATSIELHAFGGLCRWVGSPTPLGRAAIAWGGIWAQMVVLVAAWGWNALAPPQTQAAWEMWWVFSYSNLWMIGFNLLPVPPLDGAEAWPLFPRLLERIRKRLPRRARHLRAVSAPRQVRDDAESRASLHVLERADRLGKIAPAGDELHDAIDDLVAGSGIKPAGEPSDPGTKTETKK